jgi:hypothetical protein
MTRFMNYTPAGGAAIGDAPTGPAWVPVRAGERPDPGEGLPDQARAKLNALRDRLEDLPSP